MIQYDNIFNGKVPSSSFASFISKGLRISPDKIFIPHFDLNADKTYEVKIHGIHKDYQDYAPKL